MTIEKIKKAIEVMQAYVEGKKIEVCQLGYDDWNETTTISWDWGQYNYRIKPGPHYRPFKDAEEVMEAIKEHGNWLDSSVGYKVNITEFNNSMIWIGAAKGGITFDDAFNNHNFEKDGTPFGKLED